jgi:hypothetical protein
VARYGLARRGRALRRNSIAPMCAPVTSGFVDLCLQQHHHPPPPPSPSPPPQSPSKIPRTSSRGAVLTLFAVREAPRRVPSIPPGPMSGSSKLRSPGLRERLDEGLVDGCGGDGVLWLTRAPLDQSACGLVSRYRSRRYGLGGQGFARARPVVTDIWGCGPPDSP